MEAAAAMAVVTVAAVMEAAMAVVRVEAVTEVAMAGVWARSPEGTEEERSTRAATQAADGWRRLAVRPAVDLACVGGKRWSSCQTTRQLT